MEVAWWRQPIVIDLDAEEHCDTDNTRAGLQTNVTTTEAAVPTVFRMTLGSLSIAEAEVIDLCCPAPCAVYAAPGNGCRELSSFAGVSVGMRDLPKYINKPRKRSYADCVRGHEDLTQKHSSGFDTTQSLKGPCRVSGRLHPRFGPALLACTTARRTRTCVAKQPLPSRLHERLRLGLVPQLLQRLRFRATVGRLGMTRGGRRTWRKQTLLLHNVEACEASHPELPPARTDHVWLKVGKQLASLGLVHGDTVEFNARVRWYKKRGGWDLQLSNHMKLEKK